MYEKIVINLGGIPVAFESPDTSVRLICAPSHQDFIINGPNEFTIHVVSKDSKNLELGSPVFQSNNWLFYRRGELLIISGQISERLSEDLQWTLIIDPIKNNNVLYTDKLFLGGSESTLLEIPPPGLDELLAVQLLAMGRGLMFHACGLYTKYKLGLLFAGFSGSGKSTTSGLWMESEQGTLLGDERVTVQKNEGHFWMHGTAWHGSGQATTPGAVQLAHLFILHHAEKNQSRRLDPSKAVSFLLAHAFLPNWDQRGMAFTLEFLEDLCTSIPCYEFGFTPDHHAVDYVKCLISL